MCLRAGCVVALLTGVVSFSGCGRSKAISTEPAAHGTLRAERRDRTVIVEVGLGGIPESVKLVTLGLRLADGTAVFPRTVRVLGASRGDLAAAPKVEFGFGPGWPGRAAAPDAALWLQITFELDAGAGTADGSTFTLVLGDAETLQGCQLGITTSVFTRDGSPSLFGCIATEPFGQDAFLPMPPVPQPRPPVASFRFKEPPAARRQGAVVEIRPAPAPPPVPAGRGFLYGWRGTT
jgi:hypothetical protein